MFQLIWLIILIFPRCLYAHLIIDTKNTDISRKKRTWTHETSGTPSNSPTTLILYFCNTFTEISSFIMSAFGCISSDLYACQVRNNWGPLFHRHWFSSIWVCSFRVLHLSVYSSYERSSRLMHSSDLWYSLHPLSPQLWIWCDLWRERTLARGDTECTAKFPLTTCRPC